LERICGADSILTSQKRILVDFTLLTNRKTMAALFKVDLLTTLSRLRWSWGIWEGIE